LADGQETVVPLSQLLNHGRQLLMANWTAQEGAGRPLTKGTGAPVSDPGSPLVFPRAFNRVSAMDANSCYGCHNAPFGVVGGGGDFVAGVFVTGQRFDFATFDGGDATPLRGSTLENGQPAKLQTIANYRASLGMFGSGYIEMLAREMTAALQAQRDLLAPGGTVALSAKGVSFGALSRGGDGSWDVSQVEGLPAPSLATTGPANPPNLIIRPFHQAANVISVRQFTNNAYNHHHGIQSTERFGAGVDADGDGVVDELTRADVTAASLFQATMAVPGRVIPDDPVIEQAVLNGEDKFESIGCQSCHVSNLSLDSAVFSEPNPYNPAGNLQVGQAPSVSVNLNSSALPKPRLKVGPGGKTKVPAYTDLKLHDITSGPNDPNAEPIDQNAPAGSPAFLGGNRKFITKKLWGAANEPPYFHHGQFTTLREAILAHSGESLAQRQAFEALPEYDKDSIIEFLKTLRVMPPGTNYLVTNQNGAFKVWPPVSGN
jgi:hypothetical protein